MVLNESVSSMFECSQSTCLTPHGGSSNEDRQILLFSNTTQSDKVTKSPHMNLHDHPKYDKNTLVKITSECFKNAIKFDIRS